MHTITLKVQDHVLDKIVYFLNNLPKKDVQIISDKVESSIDKQDTNDNDFRHLQSSLEVIWSNKQDTNDDDFISKLIENPVHLDKNVDFLSREKAHER